MDIAARFWYDIDFFITVDFSPHVCANILFVICLHAVKSLYYMYHDYCTYIFVVEDFLYFKEYC